MLSKKEMGMIALAGVGIVGVGYFMGEGAAGGGARAGQILGSPGAIAGGTTSGLPSAGTGSSKQIAAVTGYMAPGTKTAVTPEMRKDFGFVPSKTAYAGKQQVSPTFIPEAASQAYISQTGGYEAPTFNGVGGKIIGGRYSPPAKLYPSKTQAGLTSKGLATQKKVAARSTGRAPSTTKLTSKGAAVKKRVAERKARSG